MKIVVAVRQVVDLDEDFELDCEHAALLGAAGLWSYGWEEGSRDTLPYPRAQMLARVRKEYVVHERGRRSGSLDVEHHAADSAFAERDRHTVTGGVTRAGGMYAGPKQSG